VASTHSEPDPRSHDLSPHGTRDGEVKIVPTIAFARVISQRTVSEAGQALVNLPGSESVGEIFCGLV
ncbi:MAG: hypothetical protein NTX09_19845, partial [Verrucomicrobia bacterium]|nr:hypothetical protein [Verrucomicrobiota bacterium]